MMRTIMTVAALALGVGTAHAHVTLEVPEAETGASYKAVLRVPHGCKGKPTTAIRVRIPEGVIGVKPMPKPGWTLATSKGGYARAYDYYHGAKVSEGVTEVAWSGGELPDAYYDEFVFQAFLTPALAAGSTVYFPVVQECGGEAERWIEVPAEGKDAGTLEKPAPGLKIRTP